MEVQTYEAVEPETGEHAPEMEAEAVELIDRLELEAQQRLIQGEGDERKRIPYRRMTEVEDRVYGTLLGTECEPHKYGDEVMPVRVLQVLSHAVEVFDEVKVWYADDAAVEDPILVGYLDKKKHGMGGYGKAKFLLCRWGRTLLPFDDLREMAHKALVQKWTAKAEKARAKADSFLASVESNATAYLHGESTRESLPTLGT